MCVEFFLILKIEKVTFAFLTPFTMAQQRVTSRQCDTRWKEKYASYLAKAFTKAALSVCQMRGRTKGLDASLKYIEKFIKVKLSFA